MARGPTTGIREFLADEGFTRRPPRVLVWGFVERSAHAGAFPPYPPRERLRPSVWQRLRLPDTHRESYKAFWTAYRDKWSMLRAYAVAIKAEGAWRLGGRLLTDTVLVGERPGGEFALFLRGGVERLSWSAEQRRLDAAAKRIATYAAECRRRGIHLVVLLIPDKAHVYPHWLKPEDRPAIPEPDALTGLGRRLGQRGIHVVNLLPTFLAHADGPALLYYPDDTHWNERGIRLAMEGVAQSLEARGPSLAE
jgi:hypothetical protein